MSAPGLTSGAFWKAAAERAIKTAAQAAVALITVGAVSGLLDVDTVQVLSVSGLAALVSLLTSLASDHVGPPGPSLAGETVAGRHAA